MKPPAKLNPPVSPEPVPSALELAYQSAGGRPKNKLNRRYAELTWRLRQAKLLAKCAAQPATLPTVTARERESLLAFGATCTNRQLAAEISAWLIARETTSPPADLKPWVTEELAKSQAELGQVVEAIKDVMLNPPNKDQGMAY